jgi:hypothetical protein
VTDEHENDEDLVRRLADLPREIEPDRDLWTGIERQLTPRLTGPSQSARVIPMWPALAAGLAAAAALALWWLPADDPSEPDEMAQVSPPEATQPETKDDTPPLPPAHDGELLPAETEYQDAAVLLAQAIDDRREELPGDLAFTYDESVAVVDSAIKDSRAALQNNPEDEHLRQMLDDAYQTKLDLMRQVAQAPGRS